MIIKQVKYYNENDKKFLNNPVNLTAEQLIRGYHFANIICDEVRVLGFPGTILYINGEPIVIGNAGVYNLPITENAPVVSLRVEEASMNYIKNHDYASLVITFIVNE